MTRKPGTILSHRTHTASILTAVLLLGLCSACLPSNSARRPKTPADTWTPLKLDKSGLTVRKDGTQIPWVRRGQGPTAPTILILDGLGFIEPLGRRLEAMADVVYLGGARVGPKAPSRDGTDPVILEDIEAVRAQLGLTDMMVVGYSHTALIALEYANAYPKHVKRILWVNGLCHQPGHTRFFLSKVKQQLRSKGGHAATIAELDRLTKKERHSVLDFLRGLEGRLYINKYHRYRRVRLASEHMKALMGRLVVRYPALTGPPQAPGSQRRGSSPLAMILSKMKDLSSIGWREQSLLTASSLNVGPMIKAKVLLIQGQHDQVIQLKWARALDRTLPNSKLVVFRNSGHAPMYEEPRRFVRVVMRWLGKALPPPPSAPLLPRSWQPSFARAGKPKAALEAESRRLIQSKRRRRWSGLLAGFCQGLAHVPPIKKALLGLGVSTGDIQLFVTQVCQRLAPLKPVETAPQSQPSLPPCKIAHKGGDRTIRQKHVVAVIRRAEPHLQQCYNVALRDTPELRSNGISIVLSFKLGVDGVPFAVHVHPDHDPKLTACIKGKMTQCRFPPFRGETVEVQIPVKLRPRATR